jgi:uncharacterized coiled-coil protein SlyX
MLPRVKTLIVGVLLLAVLATVGAGYLHYRGVLRDLSEARDRAARLEVQVAVQDATIAEQASALSDWQEAGRKLQASLDQMTRVAREAGAETRRLHATFAEHDLSALARARPGDVEALVDRGAERISRLLECASGADREDCDR